MTHPQLLLLLSSYALLSHTTHGFATPAIAAVSFPRPSKRPLLSTTSTTEESSVVSSAADRTPSFDSFDYLQHWYPVSWMEDLIPNQPTQLRLFDVDYAVTLVEKEDGSVQVTAVEDACPHKKAQLSQGRVTAGGFLQCAYHGWSFDAQGQCVEIPQSSASARTTFSPRTCVPSVATCVHQGMLWLWPGDAADSHKHSPPTVPEMDDPAFNTVTVVRDFPDIDWTLLISNILDPDHGMFAHQFPNMDLYAAGPTQPLQTTEKFDETGGWTLESRVPAVHKLYHNDKKKKKKKEEESIKTSTSVFHAPSVITLCRRDENNETQFIAPFYVCPTGTGSSRFMSASVGKLPFKLPRWLQHIFLNRFLDQDSLLVASQQPPVLTAEAQALSGQANNSRGRGLFCYQSPTEKFAGRIDQFWDATLTKVPNRSLRLLQGLASGAYVHTPPRTTVLDRKVQHLDICPSSQRLVRNCVAIRRASLLVAVLAMTTLPQWSKKLLVSSLAVSVATVVTRIRRAFFFCYTKERNQRDVERIPNIWADFRRDNS